MLVPNRSEALKQAPDPIIANFWTLVTANGQVELTGNCFQIGFAVSEKDPSQYTYYFIPSKDIVTEFESRGLGIKE